MKSSLETIVKKHNLGDLLSFNSVSEGVLNKNFIFETSKGKFFIKNYHAKTKARMKFINDVEKFMKTPVVPSVAAIAIDEAEGYMLYSFVESDRTHDYELKDYFKMGQMLGHIHAVTYGKNIPENLKQFPYIERDLKDMVAGIKKYEQMLEAKESRDKVDGSFLEYIQKKLSYIENYVDTPELANDTLIHGDFHAGNLLLNKDTREIIGVCDWEKAQYSPRALDVARAYLYIGFGTNTNDVVECTQIGEAVLEGYRTILSISDEEFQKGIKIRIKSNIFTHWIEDKYYIEKDARANKFIKNGIMILDHFCSRQ